MNMKKSEQSDHVAQSQQFKNISHLQENEQSVKELQIDDDTKQEGPRHFRGKSEAVTSKKLTEEELIEIKKAADLKASTNNATGNGG